MVLRTTPTSNRRHEGLKQMPRMRVNPGIQVNEVQARRRCWAVPWSACAPTKHMDQLPSTQPSTPRKVHSHRYRRAARSETTTACITSPCAATTVLPRQRPQHGERLCRTRQVLSAEVPSQHKEDVFPGRQLWALLLLRLRCRRRGWLRRRRQQQRPEAAVQHEHVGDRGARENGADLGTANLCACVSVLVADKGHTV